MSEPAMLAHGEYQQLTPHVGRIVAPNAGPMTGPGTNTYLLSRSDDPTSEITVVDPGPVFDSHIDAIMAAVGERIKRIVVTHTHTDHSPAAAKLVALTGAPCYGANPPADAAYQDETFSADVELSDDQLLDFDGVAVRAVHTPGHVANHYCFFVEADGVALTGDHLMNGSTVVIIPPSGVMRDYLDSLAKLKNYPLLHFGPGHGDLMDKPVETLDWIIEHRLAREQKVSDKLQVMKSATLDSLTPRVYDDVNKSLHFMASMSLWAHLIKLCDDGKVIAEGGSDVAPEKIVWRYA